MKTAAGGSKWCRWVGKGGGTLKKVGWRSKQQGGVEKAGGGFQAAGGGVVVRRKTGVGGKHVWVGAGAASAVALLLLLRVVLAAGSIGVVIMPALA